MNMRLMKLITVSLLLGAAACSSESSGTATSGEPAGEREANTARVTAAANRASTATLTASHAAAAAASFDTLANLVSQAQPGAKGFRSVDEVQSAALATAMPMFMVGLDGLRAFQAGQDPHALLIDEESVMYPITVGGEVRSSVVVKKRTGGTWEASSFGHANLAKSAHVGRRRVTAARGVAEADLKLIRIPTMSATLLGHEEGGKLMLTPLANIAGTSLKAGETHPADEVMTALQPIAISLNENLPD
jgi:hypothetical protein